MAGNAILLKSFARIRVEAVAAAAIKPGHLVELDANGAFILATAKSASKQRLVAVEDALQGNDINDTYAIGDLVSAYVLQPGDEAQLLAEGASGASIAIGDDLAVVAGGLLSESAGANAFYTATEALTIATGGSDTLINVRCDG